MQSWHWAEKIGVGVAVLAILLAIGHGVSNEFRVSAAVQEAGVSVHSSGVLVLTSQGAEPLDFSATDYARDGGTTRLSRFMNRIVDFTKDYYRTETPTLGQVAGVVKQMATEARSLNLDLDADFAPEEVGQPTTLKLSVEPPVRSLWRRFVGWLASLFTRAEAQVGALADWEKLLKELKEELEAATDTTQSGWHNLQATIYSLQTEITRTKDYLSYWEARGCQASMTIGAGKTTPPIFGIAQYSLTCPCQCWDNCGGWCDGSWSVVGTFLLPTKSDGPSFDNGPQGWVRGVPPCQCGCEPCDAIYPAPAPPPPAQVAPYSPISPFPDRYRISF